ncbi:cryptochrome-1-like [Tubulanus polymorphus]|uniref:cryptochrome-1-like n=1 Tax=Tubulanus polymorphus TaxID=672921 RepID=UPI003DA330B6
MSDTGPICPTSRPKNVIHWFRRGLRLHDNPALLHSLKDAETFRCVFILDPWFAGTSQVGINRWRFLIQCLEDLDAHLRKLNSRLFVIQGQPANIFPKYFKKWNITHLSFEEDPEPFGRERDAAISKIAKDANIEVIVRTSHTLYNLQQIISLNGKHAPLTYKRFQALLSKIGKPEKPHEIVTPHTIGRVFTPVSDDHDDHFGIPTLEKLSFDTENLATSVWKGGETEGLARLERHLERKAWVARFEMPKMVAQSLFPNQTSVSPYLKFGCLSVRLFYWKLTDLYKKMKKQVDPPLSLFGQILWREFFYTTATNNPKFDVMHRNPICIQIPWDRNLEALAKWAEGKTGFPWIDAIMAQLRKEGWIHHLCRHAVICFLTRGDLWLSWEEGMKVFDELMLDADWSTNAGIWIWLSCSSFFEQFLHCHCPVNFGKRADPSGDFVRTYLPVLKNMPSKYIYEPWMAPIQVQKTAKCIIGKDYPYPMVNHADVSKINTERLKQVFRHLLAKDPVGELILPKRDETHYRNVKLHRANTKQITPAMAAQSTSVKQPS